MAVISGTLLADEVTVDDNNTLYLGLTGDDTIDVFAESGVTVFGGFGDDLITVAVDGAVTINGNQGSDTISGAGGADTLRGGVGADSIDAGAGDDFVNGNIGQDTVSGGEGNDRVHGGQGADSLIGGTGDDSLYGDIGNDTVTGGDGADTFMFGVAGVLASDEVIADFSRSDGDKIGLLGNLTFADITLDTDNGNAVFTFIGNNELQHTIILEGVSGALTESDFVLL